MAGETPILKSFPSAFQPPSSKPPNSSPALFSPGHNLFPRVSPTSSRSSPSPGHQGKTDENSNTDQVFSLIMVIHMPFKICLNQNSLNTTLFLCSLGSSPLMNEREMTRMIALQNVCIQYSKSPPLPYKCIISIPIIWMSAPKNVSETSDRNSISIAVLRRKENVWMFSLDKLPHSLARCPTKSTLKISYFTNPIRSTNLTKHA